MIQKLGFKYDTTEQRLQSYFKLIALLNNLDLQVNDLNVLVWLGTNKFLHTGSKKILCAQYNIKEGNLNNVLSRLRKMKFIRTESKITTLVKAFDHNYSEKLMLQIELHVSES